MIIKQAMSVPAEPAEGLPGVTIRWLLARSDGAPMYALRLLEVQPGASTLYHAHPFEHEVYVLSGQGIVRQEAQEHPIHPGDVVLVMPNEVHQFSTTGDEPLRFLCGIPLPS